MLDCFFGVPTRAARRDGGARHRLRRLRDAGVPRRRGLGRGARAPRRPRGDSRPLRDASLERPRRAGDRASRATGFERDEPRATLHLILAGILLRDDGGRRIYGDPARVHTRDACATLERVRDAGAAMVAELLPEYADDLRAYRVARDVEPLELERSRARRSSRRRRRVAASSSASSSSSPDDGRAAASRTRRAPSPTRTARSARGRCPGTTHISVVDGDGHGRGALVDARLRARASSAAERS